MYVHLDPHRLQMSQSSYSKCHLCIHMYQVLKYGTNSQQLDLCRMMPPSTFICGFDIQTEPSEGHLVLPILYILSHIDHLLFIYPGR